MQYSLIPLKHNYEFVGDFHEGLAFVGRDSMSFKVGYINKKTLEIIPTIYYGKFSSKNQLKMVQFPLFIENRAALINNEGMFGYVNRYNDICVPFEYDNTFCFSENLAAVKKGDKWGFVDKMGNCVTSFDFDMAYCFNDDLAMVVKNDKIGYIDKTGNIVIDYQFDNQYKNTGFYNGYATVVRNNKIGVINKKGDVVITPNLKYEYIGVFKKGHAIVVSKLNNKVYYGVIDILGNEVIQTKFSYIQSFGENFIAVDDKGKLVLIKLDEGVYKNLDFDESGEVREACAFVKKNNKYGFINNDGELIIPIEFDMVYSFNEGYAVVAKEGKFGIINKSGDFIVPLIFELATPLSEGVSVVVKEGVKMLCVFDQNR